MHCLDSSEGEVGFQHLHSASSLIWVCSSIRFVAGSGDNTLSVYPTLDSISGFYIAMYNRSSRLPLRISSEGSLAHPTSMYDCAGELVGKPQQGLGRVSFQCAYFFAHWRSLDSSQFDQHRSW